MVKLRPEQPERLQIQLPHYKQKSNWDCGIACVLMVLPRKERLEFLRDFAMVCRQEGFNKSTWTIDLCYLLQRFGIQHSFYTITLGVHPGYKTHSFYDQVLNKDETRVNRRFKDAEQSGITIHRASVNSKFLIDHLIYGPVIVLTNARLLTCESCKFNKVSTELRKCLPWNPRFQGHYIVLCGYDIVRKRIYYRNPSFSDRVCVMSLLHLEEARKSYGTDEDVILIFS